MRHLLQILLALSLILNGSGFLHMPDSHAAMSQPAQEEAPCHDQAPADDHSSGSQPDCCGGSACVCASSSVAAIDACSARVPAPEHSRGMPVAQGGEPLCGPDSLLRPPIA